LVLAWMPANALRSMTSFYQQQSEQQPLPQVVPEDTATLAPSDTSTLIQDTLPQTKLYRHPGTINNAASSESELLYQDPVIISLPCLQEVEKATKFVAELTAKGIKPPF
jgi:hypothetical protein